MDDQGLYVDIEDDILAGLDRLKTDLKVRTLDTYGGQFSPEDIGQVAIQFPAVYVHISAMANTDRNQYAFRDYTIVIFAADQNARGESAGRRGGTGSPGVYAMLDAIRQKIDRCSILDGQGVPRIAEERIIGYSESNSICVAQATYNLSLEVS